ncbi:MAG: hypothetical protein CMJ83_19910 [Planctomycetes bacterium]|nr:hypothetical protein [Planctomycetota bacterium]
MSRATTLLFVLMATSGLVTGQCHCTGEVPSLNPPPPGTTPHAGCYWRITVEEWHTAPVNDHLVPGSSGIPTIGLLQVADREQTCEWAEPESSFHLHAEADQNQHGGVTSLSPETSIGVVTIRLDLVDAPVNTYAEVAVWDEPGFVLSISMKDEVRWETIMSMTVRARHCRGANNDLRLVERGNTSGSTGLGFGVTVAPGTVTATFSALSFAYQASPDLLPNGRLIQAPYAEDQKRVPSERVVLYGKVTTRGWARHWDSSFRLAPFFYSEADLKAKLTNASYCLGIAYHAACGPSTTTPTTGSGPPGGGTTPPPGGGGTTPSPSPWGQPLGNGTTTRGGIRGVIRQPLPSVIAPSGPGAPPNPHTEHGGPTLHPLPEPKENGVHEN